MILLIHVIVSLVVAGLVLYLLQLTPMDGRLRTGVHILIVVATIIWILRISGLVWPLMR